MSTSIFKKAGIIIKQNHDFAHEISTVVTILRTHSIEVFIDTECSEVELPIFSQPNEIDVLIVIGGDGSIIRAVRDYADSQTPIITINRGTVGFLAELSYDSLENDLPKLLTGQGIQERRNLLTLNIQHEGKSVFTGHCLNEAVVAQGKIARLLDITALVNDEFVAKYHADGLIVATPTGSTAYNISAGGPIVHPSLQAMILTPINAHSLSQKPIVIPGNTTVFLTPHTKNDTYNNEEVYLTLDGQITVPIAAGSTISMHMKDSVTFLRLEQETFFDTLRKKLKWGERLEK